MRIKQIKIIAFLIVFINISLFYYSLRLFSYYHKIATGELTSTVYIVNNPELELKLLGSNRISEKHISKLVTVVIREFETHANEISATVYSILKIFENIQIFILYDKIPYPPLKISSQSFNNTNVKQWNLSPSLGKAPMKTPLTSIDTKYVLFIPDATRIVSTHSVQKLLKKVNEYKGTLVVSPVSGNRALECFRLNVNTREWSLRYNIIKSTYCDAVSGKQVILLETELLQNLTSPFLLPFPSSLYVQTSALNAKICRRFSRKWWDENRYIELTECSEDTRRNILQRLKNHPISSCANRACHVCPLKIRKQELHYFRWSNGSRQIPTTWTR